MPFSLPCIEFGVVDQGINYLMPDQREGFSSRARRRGTENLPGMRQVIEITAYISPTRLLYCRLAVVRTDSRIRWKVGLMVGKSGSGATKTK